MANFVITTHWTGGDVIPLLRIGVKLKQKKHKVTFISHCIYKEIVINAGLNFSAWETEEQYLSMERDMNRFKNTFGYSDEISEFRKKYESIEVKLKEFNIIKKHCNQPDTLIISKSRSELASLMVSEKFNIPLIQVYINGYEIESMITFNQIYRDKLLGEANGLRARVGLPPINSWVSWQSSPKVQIGLWPNWYLEDNNGWTENLNLLGFPIQQKRLDIEMIPKEVVCTLKEDSSPVLITGGTSSKIDPSFYKSAIEACEIINKRAIVVTRFKNLLPKVLPSNVLWIEQLNLDDIMPKMGMIINHGGIGTVSGAIYAGIPQIVMAFGDDRPLNASIVKSLGVGEHLPPSKWNPSIIAQNIKRLLHPTFQQICKDFISSLPKEDTVLDFCELAESYIFRKDIAIKYSDILLNKNTSNMAALETESNYSLPRKLPPNTNRYILNKIKNK